jgi:hypothetical protein
MNIYRLFWNDHTFEDIQGNSIEEAFFNAGYGLIDINSLVTWVFVFN